MAVKKKTIKEVGEFKIKINNALLKSSEIRKMVLDTTNETVDKETLKLYGELILANLYRLNKGVTYYEVENYYDNCQVIKIPCNPALSPTLYLEYFRKTHKLLLA